MFDWITGVIGKAKYAGVALLTFLENLFPPIPSEIVIPAAGFVSAKGELQVGLVIAAGSVGSLVGASVWYWLGRRIGEQRLRAWVERRGKWITLGTNDVDRAKAWFDRHGRAAIFFGRLVPGVRTYISLPAGFTAMPLGQFLVYSLAGTALWTAALAYAGVALQANFKVVGDYMNIATNILFAAFGVLMVRRYIRCWRS